jgi:MFS family permease
MAPSRFQTATRALRHRNYRLFFFGQLISLCGTWMQSVAQSWLVYRLTGSAVLLGFVGFGSQIPVFLLSPLGGLLADRVSRHRILIVAQSSSMLLALVLALLTLLHVVVVWQVFVLAVALGIVNAFAIPAQSAFVVDMVGREDLMNAIALNSSVVNGARVIGPAIAGLLVAAVGEGWCFLVNGVSYVAVIVGLLLMRDIHRARRRSTGSPLENIVEGFRYIAATRPVRDLLLLIGVTSLFGMPYVVLMPIFADRILHGGAGGLGILMGASGAGALTAALSLAARRELRGLSRWVGFAAGGFGLSLIGFSLSHSFWLSVLLMVPIGLTVIIQMAGSNTLIQAMVPDALRGRVMSVYMMMFMGMAPIGALLSGSLAHTLGAAGTVGLGGVVCILGAVVFGLRLPAMREEARRIIVSTQMAAGEPAEEMTGDGETATRPGY